MSATIDGTADFVDDYTYDSQGRVVSVVEHGVSGGNAVAQKQIDMAYNTAGQLVSMARYLDDELVVVADYGYDAYDRLIGLVYRQGETILSQYVWTYSDPGEATVVGSSTSIAWQPTGGLMPITDTTGVTAALLSGGYSNLLSQLTSCTSSDGTVSYTYDATGQLTAAEYTGTQPDEVYSYDANGNRTNTGYTTGVDNRLLSDGTYCYLYDAEGNRTTRFIDVNVNGLLDSGDTTITEYDWDNRNRLTTVTDRATFGSDPTQVVDYLYDTEDRWIGRDIDLDGDGDIDQQTRFVYNGPQIILQFEGDSGEDLTVSDLSHRYLWNPTAVDHLMADEQVEMLTTPGDVVLPLSDHLGTIRDLATYDPATYTTTVTTHRTYDAYGTLLTESGSIDCLFAFTGRPFDNATDLQNNWHRWYDTITGRWMSQDPIGFDGRDTNTYRYCNNLVTVAVDPTGLAVYKLNRDIGSPKAATNSKMYSHTFVYTTDPKTQELLHTYSWGNDYTEKERGLFKKLGGWYKDFKEVDWPAAEEAIDFRKDPRAVPLFVSMYSASSSQSLVKVDPDGPRGKGMKIYGDEYNDAVEVAFNLLLVDPLSKHPWGDKQLIEYRETPSLTAHLMPMAGEIRTSILTCKEEADKLISLIQIVYQGGVGKGDWDAEAGGSAGKSHLDKYMWDGDSWVLKPNE